MEDLVNVCEINGYGRSDVENGCQVALRESKRTGSLIYTSKCAQILDFMLNATEKEDLKRIISKYVEQGRCTRPTHPDEVMQEVYRFNQTERPVADVESLEVFPPVPSKID